MLSRLVLPQRTLAAAAGAAAAKSTTPALTRAFSSTIPSLKDDDNKPRRNPLVGNYQPAQPTPTKRTPPVRTDRPNSTKPPVSSAEVPPNADLPPPPPRTSASSVENILKMSKHTPPTGSQSSSPSSGSYDINAPYVDLVGLIGKSAAQYVDSIDDVAKRPRVHTRPIAGRTIFLEGVGPGSMASKSGQGAHNPQHAFQMLHRLVMDQKIKALHYKQRYYERKGMERKRLKMQRWRVRFKKGFKAAASRVLELKKQGW